MTEKLRRLLIITSSLCSLCHNPSTIHFFCQVPFHFSHNMGCLLLQATPLTLLQFTFLAIFSLNVLFRCSYHINLFLFNQSTTPSLSQPSHNFRGLRKLYVSYDDSHYSTQGEGQEEITKDRNHPNSKDVKCNFSLQVAQMHLTIVTEFIYDLPSSVKTDRNIPIVCVSVWGGGGGWDEFQ